MGAARATRRCGCWAEQTLPGVPRLLAAGAVGAGPLLAAGRQGCLATPARPRVRRGCCTRAGVLYAASLWLSNSAYLYLSVSFIQMTKSLMPGLVYACGVALGTEQYQASLLGLLGACCSAGGAAAGRALRGRQAGAGPCTRPSAPPCTHGNHPGCAPWLHPPLLQWSSAANMSLIAFGVVVCALGEANLVYKGLAQQLVALVFEVRGGAGRRQGGSAGRSTAGHLWLVCVCVWLFGGVLGMSHRAGPNLVAAPLPFPPHHAGGAAHAGADSDECKGAGHEPAAVALLRVARLSRVPRGALP